MKRAGNLFLKILEWENVRIACWRAAKGKRHRKEVVSFLADCDRNLSEIQALLRDGEFPFGTYRQFLIRDPKPRTITAPSFTERVAHHAIINVCDPYFERFLIDATYACRRGRGRIAAVQKAAQFARESTFYLKMDIRAYFNSIDHRCLMQQLEKRFKDERLLQLFFRIIDSFHECSGKGLPIGSLTSQYFANYYLGWMDHYVKHQLRCRSYVRYMDDFVIWSDDASMLKRVLNDLRCFLHDHLRLTFKPSPFINRTKLGMSFLGCQVFANRVSLNHRNRKRISRQIASLNRRLATNDSTHIIDQQRLTSLFDFSRSATTARLRYDE